ncbi:MAG: hypothetical protein SYNGOMJ08_00836 [Candidatus Syntrophoarchaeum sp. GoM_oil]|nr:MAG: hypothetical protein SYNGOMJ08_00836 [Candidatus Syntrophoarchaeum sp. GoM_oil]
MKIIGIDYSKDKKKRGLAIGNVDSQRLELEYAGLYNDERIDRIMKGKEPFIIAIDAPLGWPLKLGEVLTEHYAGMVIEKDADKIFRRCTDEEVRKETKKQSLDVGADKIARTAHGALELLEKLRSEYKLELPLAWEPDDFKQRTEKKILSSVIEVYPAATLKQYGLSYEKYKDKKNTDERKKILKGLKTRIGTSNIEEEKAIGDDNILDATVCVLAGLDFIEGKCFEPPDREKAEKAKKEGWIWFREEARTADNRG